MGLYLNPGNEGFFESVSSKIYVDKTELIQYTNQVFRTKQKFLCVSRPRRFGKSIPYLTSLKELDVYIYTFNWFVKFLYMSIL